MGREMTADNHTAYEVQITFVMHQPNDLRLSESEIEDNVVEEFDELAFKGFSIGHAPMTPGTITVDALREWDPEVD